MILEANALHAGGYVYRVVPVSFGLAQDSELSHLDGLGCMPSPPNPKPRLQGIQKV